MREFIPNDGLDPMELLIEENISLKKQNMEIKSTLEEKMEELQDLKIRYINRLNLHRNDKQFLQIDNNLEEKKENDSISEIDINYTLDPLFKKHITISHLYESSFPIISTFVDLEIGNGDCIDDDCVNGCSKFRLFPFVFNTFLCKESKLNICNFLNIFQRLFQIEIISINTKLISEYYIIDYEYESITIKYIKNTTFKYFIDDDLKSDEIIMTNIIDPAGKIDRILYID